MSKPVWCEKWRVDIRPERYMRSNLEARVETPGNEGAFGTWTAAGESGSTYAELESDGDDVARARLAAAAPQLVRALLLAEVALHWCSEGCGNEDACGVCDWNPWRGGAHNPGCELDAALTAAGFPDQASRDEARRVMGEAKP